MKHKVEDIKLLGLCILLFVVSWIFSKDVRTALYFTVFLSGMYILLFSICEFYRALKRNRFNFKIAIQDVNWKFIFISTPVILILFIFVLPEMIQVLAYVTSIVLLIILFIYDLISNGSK